MPVRQYLDNTVVPILLQAMTELAKERYSLVDEDPTILSSMLRSICSIIRMARVQPIGSPRSDLYAKHYLSILS